MLGGGWQSGLLTAGGQGVSQPKAAYAQLASDFGAGRAACKGAMVSWSPARLVAAEPASEERAENRTKLEHQERESSTQRQKHTATRGTSRSRSSTSKS